MEIGVLVYHLNYLEKRNILSSEMDGYRKRYFVREEIRKQDRPIMGLLRQEMPRRFVVHVLLHPNSSFKDLLTAFGVSKSTLSFHLKKLIEAQVFEVQTKGRENYYSVKQEERVADLLITYKSSFLDDVVDRFAEVWMEIRP